MLVAHSHYVQGGSFPLSRHPRGTAAPHSAAHRLFRSSLSRSARPKPSPHMRAASRRPDRWITLKADQARAPINRDAGWHGVGSTAAARTPQCTAISWVGGGRGKGWQRSAWIPGPSTPNAAPLPTAPRGWLQQNGWYHESPHVLANRMMYDMTLLGQIPRMT